jgi:hypothetical protein
MRAVAIIDQYMNEGINQSFEEKRERESMPCIYKIPLSLLNLD